MTSSLEARIAELEEALAVVPVLTAKLIETEKERDKYKRLWKEAHALQRP